MPLPRRPARRGTRRRRAHRPRALVALLLALALAGGAGCLWRDGRTQPLPTADERSAARRAAASPRSGAAPDTVFPLPHPAVPEAAPRDAAVRRLRDDLEALLAADDLRGSLQAVAIVDLERDEWLLLRDADLSLRPASSLKLLTTAALLDRFGADHALRTSLVLAGTLDPDGTARGHLLVEARGDPSISGRYDPAGRSTTAILDEWAAALRARGVRRLEGGVVIDDRGAAMVGPNPWWEVEDLGASYAAPVSTFAVNDNCVDVRVVPAPAAGEAARVILSPPNSLVALRADVATIASGPTRIDARRDPATGTLVVSGRIAVDAAPHDLWRAVDDGDRWSADVLVLALARAGITCADPPRRWSQLEPAAWRALADAPRLPLHDHLSRSLFELVTIINKPSQNFYADMMLGVLARDAAGADTAEARDGALRAFLRRLGIDDAGLAVADGSGLSWRNLATARQLAELLRAMARHRDAAPFYNSLPIAGIDGTMARRLADGPSAGNVRAKTGYIHRTRSIAGYVTCRDGRRLAFAFLSNNYTVPTARINALHDEMLRRLAAWERTTR